jgi:hypothetical protein
MQLIKKRWLLHKVNRKWGDPYPLLNRDAFKGTAQRDGASRNKVHSKCLY